MDLHIVISKFFFKSDETLLKRLLLLPLEILSYLYAVIIYVKNFLYDIKVFRGENLSSFVISVGNLTVGGSGKTPVVIAMTDYLKKKGYSVGVVARSYHARTKGNFCLYDDDPFYSASLYGDEPVLLKKKLKKTPVFAGKNKTEVALQLKKAFNPDFIVIDDAFSHRKVARNIDILMIDRDIGFGNGYLLPRGPLREPVSSIKRADVLLFKTIEGTNSCAEINSDIIKSRHCYNSIIKMDSIKSILNESAEIDLKDKRFIAFCGIGNANSFREMLLVNKLDPRDFIEFDDHFAYDIDIVRQIDERAVKNQCDFALCTEKDAVKLLEILHNVKTRSNFCFMSIKVLLDTEFYDFVEGKISEYENERKKKSGFFFLRWNNQRRGRLCQPYITIQVYPIRSAWLKTYQ